MVFHWGPSNSKFPQVSGTRLRILADLNNAVVRMVSVRRAISNSSSFLPNILGIVLSSPKTTGITVTFMFHNIFSSHATSKYLSPFLFSVIFTLCFVGTVKSTIQLVLFSFFFFHLYFLLLLLLTKSDLLAEIR